MDVQDVLAVERMNGEGPLPALGWSVKTRYEVDIFGPEKCYSVQDAAGNIIAVCRDRSDAVLIVEQRG